LNINVPTYIRTLEFAREDAKDDVDLHKLTENALEVSEKEGVVEMDDYEEIVPKLARGGKVDLFETPEKIPAKVSEVLDAFADGIESGAYDILQKAKEGVEAVGYTFDFDLDGTMYGLRKMEKGGEMPTESFMGVNLRSDNCTIGQ
jgi:hypothetical protein